MDQRLFVRARRRRPKLPVHFLLPAPAEAGAGAAAPASLRMPESHGRAGTLISGSIATALHLGLLAALIATAMLAPVELIEKIIPVEIVHAIKPIELPGSNAEPAPTGPKSVGMVRPSAAALAAARALTPEQAEALRRAALEAARRALEALEFEAQQQTALPTRIERREVQAQNLAALAVTALAPAEAITAEDLRAVEIDPAELAPLELDLAGPRQIDTSDLGDLSIPEAFALLSELRETDYSGSVAATHTAIGADIARGYGDTGTGIDTGVSSTYGGGGPGSGGGGGGTGGSGTAVGAVRCLESGFVQRYQDMLEDRTMRRWTVPDGVPPDTQVRLRFTLDAAGMVSDVEPVEGQNGALAESARLALLSAAPFPPMDDHNRCLAGRRLLSTFSVPAR